MCFVFDNYDHLLKLQNLFSTLIKLERKITQVLKSNKQKQKRTWSVRQANLQGKTQKRRRNVIFYYYSTRYSINRPGRLLNFESGRLLKFHHFQQV